MKLNWRQEKKYEWAVQTLRSEADEEQCIKAINTLEKLAFSGYKRAKLFLEMFYMSGKIGEENLLKVAENENSIASSVIGLCYLKGIGVPQDFKLALQWREKLAEQGAVIAQYDVAELYFNGKAGEKNLEKAFEYYKKAAEQGHDKAQNRLGQCYENSWGIAQDFKKALFWYEKSTEKGNLSATWNVALLYENGKAGEKNLEKAFEHYKKAAEQGHAKAQNRLGQCYENSWGVAQDFKQALFWYEKAAEQGVASAQYNAALLYEKGKTGVRNLKKAFGYFKNAAEQGHKEAQNWVGIYYRGGRGVAQDPKKALFWYEKSAEQGCATAQWSAALLYENGKAGEKNLEKALKCYKKVAEQGDSEAQAKLGEYYENGWGVAQDYEKALYWYEKAGASGNSKAQWRIAWIYAKGKAGELNYEKAFEYCEEAAKQGHVEAQEMLGRCYQVGCGVAINLENAIYWYEKAAEQGNVLAKYKIVSLYGTGKLEERDFDKEWELLKDILGSKEANEDSKFLKKTLDLVYALGETFEIQNSEVSNTKAIECFEEIYEIIIQEDYERCEIEFNKLAIRVLEKLVLLGESAAYYFLANAYRTGKYIDKDSEKARYYLMKEIDLKSKTSLFIKAGLGLGETDWFMTCEEMQDWIYMNTEWQKEGKGVSQNHEEAFDIFTYLVKWNNTDALWGLALCYHFGLGTKSNAELALEYLRQFKSNQSTCDMLRGLDVSIYEKKFAYPVLKKYLKEYEEDNTNWYTEENSTYKNLRIPDLSAFFETKEQAYRCAVEFDFGEESDKQCAIMAYSYAASIGSKKALYTLINMAMEETEYFIDVISLIDGGEN